MTPALATSVLWLLIGDVAAPAEDSALTVIDLSDEWAPRMLSETAERPQAYRATFLALANERLDQVLDETPRRDRYFELFGIFPSIGVVRRRLLDEARHACHARIDGAPLRAFQKTVVPWERGGGAGETAALRVVQEHLRCEGFLAESARGHFDASTSAALRLYQQRHMLPSAGVLDRETRETFLTDSRELDFRTLLRALRERVVDATGLIEDGSAANAWEPVLGRFIDSEEYRRVLRPPLVGGAPDLVARATSMAATALGWTSPESAVQALARTPEQVTLHLPDLPSYRGKPSSVRAEIDRGDVWTGYPFDAEGRVRRSPAKYRPTFTLFVKTESGETPLARWPTTIGGWKMEMAGGTETLRYKGSPVGRRYWRELVVAPAWFPPDTTPDRELVRRRPDGRWTADTDAVGPGYRSAYGLVALFHDRAVGTTGGQMQYTDAEIRTHGSGNYRSILRGSSHGCHRLFNHLAIRLASFVLANTEHVRVGLGRERYSRTLHWKGETYRLRVDSRGYRYELQPPVPIDVLPGRRVRSRGEAVHGPVEPVAPPSPAAGPRT